MAKRKTIPVGSKFHYLTVIGDAPNIDGRSAVTVVCDCGAVKQIRGYCLLNGSSKSCGCKRAQIWMENACTKKRNGNTAFGSKWIVSGDVARLDRDDVEVLVSAVDVPLVSKYRWHCHRYVIGFLQNVSTSYHLHRVILSPNNDQIVDHANGNTYDNRRENIRICTHQQNMHNKSSAKKSSSKYKGVYKTGNRWYSQIKVSGKSHHLGVFDEEEKAAKAYDDAAIFFQGEFAKLNLQN